MQKRIAAQVFEKFPLLRKSAPQFYFKPGTTFAYWHEESQRFGYTLVSKVRCGVKPNPPDEANTVEAMREHALRNYVKVNAMPRLASSLDGLTWSEIQRMLLDIFWNSGMQIKAHYLPLFPQRPLSGPRRPGHNVSAVQLLYSLN